MPAKNLATVFAPSMLRHADEQRSLQGLRDGIVVVTRLIEERAVIFGEHARRHPPHIYSKAFNTLEAAGCVRAVSVFVLVLTHACSVARILEAQMQQGKLLTEQQKLGTPRRLWTACRIHARISGQRRCSETIRERAAAR
jgi:hypothetical protein